MKTNRPQLKVPLESLDIIVDLLSITLYIVMFVYTAMSYNALSDSIPTHFNASGEADAFGSKTYIWFLPTIGVFTFVLLFFLNRFPHLHNYMVNITEKNALKNYRFSTRIVRFTNLLVAILFAVILYVMIAQGQGNAISFGSWLMPTIIGSSLLLPLFIFIYNRKINKT